MEARIQELRAELIREEDRLRQRLLRDPTQAELARSLGLPRSGVRGAHECSRERLIVRLRFVEERTQAEIGVVFGVSQMQVSRLLAGILRKLRNDLLELAA